MPVPGVVFALLTDTESTSAGSLTGTDEMKIAWLRNVPELLGLADFGFDDADTDRSGNIYISDSVNSRVYRFRCDGSLDDAFPVANSPEESSLNLAVSQDGDFYLAHTSSETVRRYDAQGRLLGEFSVPGVLALCKGAEGLIYVLSNEDGTEQISVCDPLGWIIEKLPAPPRYRAILDPTLANLDADAHGNIYVTYGMPPYQIWKVHPGGSSADAWSRPLDHPEDAVLISDIAFDPAANVVWILLARREAGRQQLDAFGIDGEFVGSSPIPHSDSLYGIVCSSGDGYLYLLETSNSPGAGVLARVSADL